MNAVAYLDSGVTLYWSGLVFALGLAAGLSLTLALYPRYNRHTAAVWVFFPFALVLGLGFSRLIYWYCQMEQFSSFWQAIGELNRGSFALFGVIPGVLCAAWSRLEIQAARPCEPRGASPGRRRAGALSELCLHPSLRALGQRLPQPHRRERPLLPAPSLRRAQH